MGSRRPKKERHVKSTSPQAITTSTASAIDGETHDRIVGSLKMELDGWQTKANFNEDLAERTKQDALKMAADYRSRLDALSAELKVAMSSLSELKSDHQKFKEHHERVVQQLNEQHGRLVKKYRDDLESASAHVALLEEELGKEGAHDGADGSQRQRNEAPYDPEGASQAEEAEPEGDREVRQDDDDDDQSLGSRPNEGDR